MVVGHRRGPTEPEYPSPPAHHRLNRTIAVGHVDCPRRQCVYCGNDNVAAEPGRAKGPVYRAIADAIDAGRGDRARFGRARAAAASGPRRPPRRHRDHHHPSLHGGRAPGADVRSRRPRHIHPRATSRRNRERQRPARSEHQHADAGQGGRQSRSRISCRGASCRGRRSSATRPTAVISGIARRWPPGWPSAGCRSIPITSC